MALCGEYHPVGRKAEHWGTEANCDSISIRRGMTSGIPARRVRCLGWACVKKSELGSGRLTRHTVVMECLGGIYSVGQRTFSFHRGSGSELRQAGNHLNPRILHQTRGVPGRGQTDSFSIAGVLSWPGNIIWYPSISPSMHVIHQPMPVLFACIGRPL
jgi:hypothetical protein